MKTKTKLVVAGGVGALVAAGLGSGAAIAATADDTEQPITGAAYDRASAVALDHTGEGQVTETEVGDEDSYYEVEVTLDDGKQVDVQLDEDFKVVSASADAADGEGEDND